MEDSPTVLKLPRKVEADARREQIEALLKKDLRPLWEKSTRQVAHIPLLQGLEDTLVKALHFRHLEPGLEHIEAVLNSEKKGLSALQAKQGTAPAHRVSRLLIIANDGSERFYRACDSILLHHGDRVLILAVDVPCARLGLNLFGPEKAVKALLVSDREAVSNVLLSLV